MELTRNQFTIPQKFKKAATDQKSNKRTRNPKSQRKKHGRTDPLQVCWKQEFHDHSPNHYQVQRSDGYENKEECPIFTNKTQNKVSIQTIETIIVLGNCYDWKESGAGKEKLYYQNFGRAMKGEPSKKWEGLIESIRTKTADNFKTKVVELVEEIMGKDVYKDQMKYSVDTPQPAN